MKKFIISYQLESRQYVGEDCDLMIVNAEDEEKAVEMMATFMPGKFVAKFIGHLTVGPGVIGSVDVMNCTTVFSSNKKKVELANFIGVSKKGKA